MEEQKTLKQYAREAKKRLKNGFWSRYNDGLKAEIERAEESGISVSKVKEYYASRVYYDIKVGDTESDEFYLKVKNILDEEGEVSNAIGRLTDKSLYDSLSYEEKQRYTLTLSEKYLKAVERYKKEKEISGK